MTLISSIPLHILLSCDLFFVRRLISVDLVCLFSVSFVFTETPNPAPDGRKPISRHGPWIVSRLVCRRGAISANLMVWSIRRRFRSLDVYVVVVSDERRDLVL